MLDYIALLNQHLGTQITLEITSTMAEFSKKLSSGKIDGIASVHPLPRWEKQFDFTDTFAKIQQYLFVRDEKQVGIQLTDLHKKSVGYLKDVEVSKQILALHPEVNAIAYDNLKAMVNGLLTREVDALLAHIHLEHWRKNHTNLSFHIASIVDESNADIVMAIRKDWQELIPILNKGIASIGSNKANKLLKQWLGDIETEPKQHLFEKHNELQDVLLGIVGIFIALLISFYFIFPRFSSEKKLAKSFSSGKFRLFILFVLSLIVSLSVLLVWHTLEENYRKTLLTAKKDLEASLEMSRQHLNFFISEKKNYLSQLSRDSELIAITEQLLALSHQGQSLKDSVALKQAMDFFNQRNFDFEHNGFFIISPDNITLACSHNRNIGSQNFIRFQAPKFIEQALAGKTVFIPPLHSEIPFNGDSRAKTLFFVAPIKNAQDEVIALLSQRLIPEQLLSHQRTMNHDDKTVVVDKEGQPLTGTSFLSAKPQMSVLKNSSAHTPIKPPFANDNPLDSNTPRMPIDKVALSRPVEAIIQLSQQGNSKIQVDTDGYHDNQGRLVYGAWTWDKNLGLGLAIETEADEVLAEYGSLKQTLLLITGMTLLLSIVTTLITLMFGQRTARTLNNSRNILEKLVDRRTQELKKLTVAVEQSPSSIVMTDLEGNIEYVNPRFTETTGYSAEEALGQNPRLLHSGLTSLATYSELWDTLKKGQVWKGEFINQRKNKELYWEHAIIAPIRDEQGNTINYVGVKEDITPYKQAEEQNTRLGRILEDSLNEIYIFDAKSLLFIQVNRGARNNLGYSMEELKKLTPVDIKPEYTSKSFRECIEPLYAGTAPFLLFKTQHRHKDGSLYPVEVHLQLAKAEISSVFVAIIQDISERNKAEALLKQAKMDAEKASTAKSQFIASMSHELRTPLNAILGFSHIMENAENLTEKQQENLRIINKSGTHLLDLINDVLDISKIEAGKVELHEKDFDLYALLEEMKDIFMAPVHEKSLSLSFDYPKDLPRYIHADERKLRQVLINLIGNAIKFTLRGGISIHLRQQQKHQQQMLHVEIEDTGCGIKESELKHLFRNFSQTSSGLKSQQGTGLGLAISRQFIRLMGGDMSVESREGKGSIFKFDLQIVTAKQSGNLSDNTSKELAMVPGEKTYRILVVDDSDINRLLLIELLSSFNFEFQEAKDGQQGIEIWKEWQPHITLMDINMPKVDGYEATRQIKALSREAIIIAITTTTAFDDIKQQVLEAGCCDFITKPFEQADIFEALKKHLQLKYFHEEQSSSVEQSDATKILNAETVSRLPNELRQQLKQAISVVDTEKIDILLEQIHQQQNARLADAIKQQVDDFQYDSLLKLFE